MKRWFVLLIGVALLFQAIPCSGEDEIPDIEIIRRIQTVPPLGEVSAPELSIDNVVDQRYGIAFVTGDSIVLNWHAEGEVQTYHVSITGEDGREIKVFDTNDGVGVVKASELSEEDAYILTVTAIPVNGTLAANGISTTARFARYIEPEPTLKPMPEPTSLPFITENEISDSWEEILAAIDAGSAQQRYAIGQTKELNLGPLGIIHMQLAGFDLDERADSEEKAATTWIALELLPNPHEMNQNSSNDGGWEASELRTYLQTTVLQSIPDAVRDRLICVKKKQMLPSKETQVTEDLLWIPDKDEISGKKPLYKGIFHSENESRIKLMNGSDNWWWLRSTFWQNDYDFRRVRKDGKITSNVADYAGGIALGFCL